MIPNTNEIAKQTLIALKERKLKPTPENYTEIFEELSLKYGITSSNKAKLDKYKTLLLPIYQQELNSKTIRSLEELISFLISVLNRQSGKQFSEFFDFLYTISKTLQISKDKKIRDLAKVTSIRISKTMDSESIYLLTKKWKELERNYDENDLEEQARKYGISKYDDYDSVIKKLLVKLEERSYEHFSELLCLGLNPSLVEDLKIQGFIQNLTQKPFVIGEENFKNELMEFINHRIMVDNMYVQKNLNFFNDNLKKIYELLVLLNKSNEKNMDFINTLKPDENGEVKLSFEDLKLKFKQLGEKITSLNNQIEFTQSLEEREAWSVLKELDKMDENFNKYKNVIIALSNIVLDYIFIVELGWGLFSAALATCLGLVLGGIFGIFPFLFQNLELKISSLYMNLKIFKNILYNGSSEFFGNISGSLYSIFANFVLLKISDTQAVAAFSIVLYIDSFIIMLIIAIGDAMQPALSYNYAKKDFSRIKAIIKVVFFAGGFLSLFSIVLILIFGENLITLFTKENNQEF